MSVNAFKYCQNWMVMSGLMLGAIVAWAPVTTAQSPIANLPRTARIQTITGKGKVRIDGETPPRKFFAGVSTELNQGDLIFPERGARVTVLCPDGSSRSVAPGKPSGLGSICLVWRTDGPRGTQAAETAGGLDDAIPYLLAPRHTLLLSQTPMLRWHPVSGANQYHVAVNSPSGLVWQTQTQATQIVYAGKPLTPGVVYSLVVTTNAGRSSDEDKTPGGDRTITDFRVLRPAEVAAVRSTTAKLLQGKPPDEATALMLATYYGDYLVPPDAIAAYGLSQDNYQTYSLSADAIALLENQLQQGKQSPLLYRTLGDLYWQSGLIRLAGEAYTKAIAQVQTPEDLEAWTLAYYGLGKVYVTLGEPQQTLQCLTQARIGFLFLGNQAKARELQRQIEQMRKAAGTSLNRQMLTAVVEHR